MFLRIACSLFLFLAPLSVAFPAETPKAVFPETQFTFGKVMRGTEIQHEFVLRNEGKAALRILGVSCTAPLLLDRMPAHLEPMAEVRLRVQLDTSKLSGPFEGQISILLNDPVLPEGLLVFEGRVVPPIELLPRPVVFLAARRGESKSAAVEIINHESEPLQIESVQHPKERFTTKLETVEEGRRYRLKLTLNPDAPGGKNSETIVLKTSSHTTPLLRIPANTFLRERVYAFPDEVDLGALRLADIIKQPDLLERTAQILMMYQWGGSDFRVNLRTDLPLLDLKWERGPNGDRYQATIKLIPGKLQKGPIKGNISIETNDPEFPNLTVPVTGLILGP
jgi:hypothetical protein